MKTNHSTFLILAILVSMFTIAVYAYMYVTIDISLKKTVKAQTVANASALAKNREKSFLETYEKTSAKWSLIKNFFVSSNKIVDFIEVVEKLGDQSGSRVSIRSIEADNLDNAPIDKEGTVRLKVNARGSWQTVMKALSLAELLPYKVNVNNIQVSSYKDTTNLSKNNVAQQAEWDMSFDIQATMIAVASSTASIK